MKIPPEWAIGMRAKMMSYGIRYSDVAKRLGKSIQWVSNILTGFYVSENTKATLCECVDTLIQERRGESA